MTKSNAMAKRTFYVAGPMSGIPQFNIPAFDDMATWLREIGFKVVNPAELDDPAMREACLASEDGSPNVQTLGGQTYGEILARDIRIILDAVTDIIVLPDWYYSTGARIEVATGLSKGVRILQRVRTDSLPVVMRTKYILRQIHTGLMNIPL